jgi:hypothetical protein
MHLKESKADIPYPFTKLDTLVDAIVVNGENVSDVPTPDVDETNSCVQLIHQGHRLTLEKIAAEERTSVMGSGDAHLTKQPRIRERGHPRLR